MRFSLACTLSLLAIGTASQTSPVFAQAKGFTVVWTVTVNQPVEISDKDGKKIVVKPNRTYSATEKLGPLKKDGLPLADMDKLQKMSPTAMMALMQNYQQSAAVGSDTVPVIKFSIKDEFMESITRPYEGGVLLTDGLEGTISGSGTSTYKYSGNTRTTLGYDVAKKEYQLWLPFFITHNGPNVYREYHNFGIKGANGKKEIRENSGAKGEVESTIAANLKSVNKEEKIWPVLRATGAMPITINKTIPALYMIPGSSTEVPVKVMVKAVITPIK